MENKLWAGFFGYSVRKVPSTHVPDR